jgi:hypothetical protein
MWQVDNRTPFAADRAWARDRRGAEVWLVAVKATFDLAPDGNATVAAEQPPVLRVAEHHGEPVRTSIKYDADLVLTKTTSDVIVVGHAYAPGGRAVTQVDVGMKVGPLQKVLRVFGDRTWESSGPSQPSAFVKIPLTYERAYGGCDGGSTDQTGLDWDVRNPVGVGYATTSGKARGTAVPNIEDPGHLLSSWRDRPAPAGFGAIAPHWPPRAAWAGTYDDAWLRERQPLLPDDFNDRYFQCAPADQQTPGFLRGGEDVAIVGMTASGDLRFRLPRIHLGFESRFYDGTVAIHTNRNLHTVIIEPDFPRVSLVWHSAHPCHSKVQKLERTVVTLKRHRAVHESEPSGGVVESAA